MHTSNKFKENILLIIGLILFILAGLLRTYEIVALFIALFGLLALFISSWYTIKRRFSNLIAYVKSWFN